MSLFIKTINIPARDLTGISSFGNLPITIGTTNLSLTGALVGNQGQVLFQDKGYSSAVNFTSTDDMSAVSFIVEGISNKVFVVDEIQGLNNNTVISKTMFDVVTSIKINSTVNANFTFSIGANYNVLTTFESFLDTKKTDSAYRSYRILTSNITATDDWAAGTFMQYGIASRIITGPYIVDNFRYNNRQINYISLTNETNPTSASDLNRGVFTNQNYSFVQIASVILDGVNVTPTFLEYSQDT